MMPSEVERAYWARRLSLSGYVDWLAEQMDLPVDENMYGKSKNVIDYRYQTMLSEKPTWVEAAEEVLAEAVQEEAVEEEYHHTSPDEEDFVDEDGDGEPDVVTHGPFSEDTDYDAMTVVELRELCRERDLIVRGTKAEIVLRLRRDDEGIDETVETDNDETEAPSEPDVPEEAAEESSDAPEPDVPEEAATEEVTTNADSGETNDIDEEE